MRGPNFLLFITDQQRADHLGCYGNAIVRTPNIDRLAERGTRFERFFVATPICMPNRATLMTGRMPSLHGSRHNGISLSLGATTFVDILAAAGYATALIGKCHLQSTSAAQPVVGLPEPDARLAPAPEELKEAGKGFTRPGRYDQELRSTWRENPDFALTLPYYGFAHVELCTGHGDATIGHYATWLNQRQPGADNLRGRDNQLPGNGYACPQAWRTAVPDELYPTAFVAERTIAYLDDHARERRNTPFFLQCSFPDPHHPFTPPGKYWDMYDPADIPLPSSFDGNDNPPPHLAHILSQRDAGTADRNGRTALGITAREAREANALTYGMISNIDDKVGRVLERLDDLELSKDTVVIFTTDHGDFMGDHQLLLKGALHYRGLVRVPFIWAEPQAKAAARGLVCNGLSGTLDIARSVLDRASLAPHNGIQGVSLQPAIAGGETGHDSLLIEEHQRKGYMGLADNFHARTLMTERHRLTVYDVADWGELYDLENDPDELHNLWDAPEQGESKAALMERLARKMMALSEESPLATHHGP